MSSQGWRCTVSENAPEVLKSDEYFIQKRTDGQIAVQRANFFTKTPDPDKASPMEVYNTLMSALMDLPDEAAVVIQESLLGD